MLLIANPIYDVVFKYLLEDLEVAKIIISILIGEEVIDLEYLAQERIAKVRDLRVFRMDFKTKIKTENGFKIVMVEIQKASVSKEIVRFRKYLGEQYRDQNNLVDGKAIPIYPIFFIGKPLAKIQEPVIKIVRHYENQYSEPLKVDKEHFIESVSHDCMIIQISYSGKQSQSKIDKLLLFFDQDNKRSAPISEQEYEELLLNPNKKHPKGKMKYHFLEFDEEKVPEGFEKIFRRLLKAASDNEVAELMDMEDSILSELEEFENEIENKDKKLIDYVIKLNSKDKELEFERQNAENERQKAKNLQVEVAKKLILKGMDIDFISDTTGLSIEEIEKFQ